MTDRPLVRNAPPLQPEAFTPLPLGAVRPAGWLKDQLTVQARGLTGHLEEVWPDVGGDSAWLGGAGEGWERGPYYLDGLVPLAWMLDDEALQAKARKWIDWTLDHQRADGWLGPVQAPKRRAYDLWPVAIMLKVLTQFHEATYDARVMPAIERFCDWLRGNIDEHPLHEWGAYRWADLVLSLHWLYNRTRQGWLLKLAEKVHQQGYDWREHFADFRFTGKTPTEAVQLKTHVVNNAMAIKAGGVWFAQSGDAADRADVYRAIEMLETYHGTVAGTFTGDEHYAGKDPSQGTELCAVVEQMYSLETLLSVLGDPTLADRLERIAYNALPATFTPDMWAHQYDQQVNQVLCTVAERQWTNNESDANIFGLAPNFGCCTANMHQGWPKLVKSLWMATQDGGLAGLVHGPCEVTAPVAGGQMVHLQTDTRYPFGDRVRITVRGSGEFPLLLRIPAWAEGAGVLVNGRPDGAPEGGFVRVRRRWRDGDRIELHLPMPVRVERRHHDAVAVTRGPLVFALKIGEQFRKLKGEPPCADWEVLPTTPWNYGLLIDPDDPAASVRVTESGTVSPVPFDPAATPVTLTARGRRVDAWRMRQNSAGPLPASPVAGDGPLEELTLIPYGSTHLRVTEFPRLTG